MMVLMVMVAEESLALIHYALIKNYLHGYILLQLKMMMIKLTIRDLHQKFKTIIDKHTDPWWCPPPPPQADVRCCRRLLKALGMTGVFGTELGLQSRGKCSIQNRENSRAKSLGGRIRSREFLRKVYLLRQYIY